MLDRERVLEGAKVLHQEAADLVGLEKPLVPVQGDGVGSFDAFQELPSLGRQHREAAVRCIGMQPDPFGFAEVGHFHERIDRPVAGGAGVGADHHGGKSGGTVIGDGTGECIHVQTQGPVDGNRADAFGADADDPGGADLRAVALVAHVYGRPLGIARGFPCRDERVEGSRRPAAGQQSARSVRIADPAPEPVDDHELKLARTTGDQPGADVEVVPGCDEVGQYPGPCGCGGNEREAAGMVQSDRVRKYFPGNPLDDFVGGAAFLGRFFQEYGFEGFPEVAVPGAFFRQALQSFHQQFHGPVSEIPHQVGRHIEFALYLIATARFRRFFVACRVSHLASIAFCRHCVLVVSGRYI